MQNFRLSPTAHAVLLAFSIAAVPCAADPSDRPSAPAAKTQVATGQFVTPLALDGAVQQLLNPGLPDYPNFVAGEAVRSQLSPDGRILAILCAGQNSLVKADGTTDAANSTQYLFLYDVAGSNRKNPKLIQVIKQTNAHVGLVWAPDGHALYAAGGSDDAVYAYGKTGATWAQTAKIALGHNGKGVGLFVQPNAGGLAVSADGATLVVANNYNDSISVIDTATNTVRYEYDLRPFAAGNEGANGGAGGTYPFAVTVKGNGIAYVSANRDREVVVVDVSAPTAGHLISRIKLDGNPLGMTLDAAQKTLYVAQDNADQVAVIDTTRNRVIGKIDTRGLSKEDNEGREAPRYTGASPIAVTISPDGGTLYAVNDGSNSIAVIPLKGRNARHVFGLIPTAYAPKDVSFSPDGKWMYIINGKSQTGPNPGRLFFNTARLTSATYTDGRITAPDGKPAAPAKTSSYPLGNGCDAKCQADNSAATSAAGAANQYQFQLEQASLVSAPVPGSVGLKRLTRQVAANNFYGRQSEKDAKVMAFLRDKIKHVIYIVKENRTFDQVLGDLNNGSNGEPALTVFGKAITPNHHKMASEFVTLDNFMDPGDGSMDGWSWTMQGRVTSTEAITQQINYAFVNRGLSYESEGTNRNVPVNYKAVADRDAVAGSAGTTNYSTAAAAVSGGPANLLAGNGNHASTDAPYGKQKGYIFNAVMNAGGTVRNYGFLVNNIGPIKDSAGNEIADPYGASAIQVGPLEPSLASSTDVYFRGYDQNYPDMYRYNEWKREFDQYVANGKLPSLSMVRISHDHMGNFATALAKVNTPETQQADTDLALGKMVEAVAHSRYAKDTLFVVIEDDCQDGPDHVDSHRATTYVVGPYVKKHAVVSTRYSQVNALRTIEDILGTEHMNLNTAYQGPMADVFDIKASPEWDFTAEASTVLAVTSLNLGGTNFATGPSVQPKHDAQYWAKATAGFDFSGADQVPVARFNQVLWKGMKPGQPYPKVHSQFMASADLDD